MPAWYIFVALLVLAIWGFTHLWIHAGKDEHTDYTPAIPQIRKDIALIKAKLGISDDTTNTKRVKRLKPSKHKKRGDPNGKGEKKDNQT